MRRPVLLLLAVLSGCSEPPPAEPSDARLPDSSHDAGVTPDSHRADPAHLARVFPINPIATPTPQLAELDPEDTLTGPPDSTGLRRLAAYSCVDEGETLQTPGAGLQRVCTLRQLASSKEHGSFIYEDWAGAIQGTLDVTDVHAEVSLYYHASKVYDFVESTGLAGLLRKRHEVEGALLPITLVANYRLPAAPSAPALTPAGVAMYLPRELGRLGLWSAQGLPGIQGDALVFGQGANADFAYDGETIYHEFGHLVGAALAGLSSYVYPDDYGLTNVTNLVGEGVADTLAFLVSGRSALFDYLDQVAGHGFARNADNQAAFPAHLRGLDPFDGQVVSGANYEAFTLLQQGASVDAREFGVILLQTVAAMKALQCRVTLTQYADLFLTALEQRGQGGSAAAVRAVFTRRGFYQTERAKDITAYDGTQAAHVLYTGGTSSNPAVSPLLLGETPVYPAYVQTYVEIPATGTRIRLSAAPSLAKGTKGTVDYAVLLRKGGPILWAKSASGIEVQHDALLEPAATGQTTSWTADGLQPLTRYYFQFINRGSAAGVLTNIAVRLE